MISETATVDKSGERVRRMFAEIAPRYDLLNHVLSLNIDRYWRWKTLKLLKLQSGIPFLDVCTGTGADNHRFGEMATAGDWGHEIPVVMQFDACGALLDFGRRQRVPHAGLWRKIRFRGPVVRQ